MKRSGFHAGALLVVLIAFPISASARVSGPCSNCHTMHNSQNGGAVTFDSSVTPNTGLVRGDCTGCHAEHLGNNVKTVGTSRIPQVYHTNVTDLAAGNFSYIDGTKGGGASATKGHNVYASLSEIGQDGTLATPPGDEFSTGITNINFTCAGQYGCHGDRTKTSDILAIKYAHHASDATIDGSTVARSYRFLKGVKGVENNHATYGWQNYSSTYTNVYKGVNGADADIGKTSPGSNGTISGLCSECHGTAQGWDEDAWVRHPTDVLLPDSGAYAAYNPLTGYDAMVPVAYTNPASPTRATAVVMCLSCHAAHGTNYPDILRWDYGGGVTTGCVKCHSNM